MRLFLKILPGKFDELKPAGISKVYNKTGGISAWVKQG